MSTEQYTVDALTDTTGAEWDTPPKVTMRPHRIAPDSGFHHDVAERVQAVIAESGDGLVAFATRLSLAPAPLEEALRGARRWHIDQLLAIAAEGHTTAEWLLTGRGS